jgi:hypothetical protein
MLLFGPWVPMSHVQLHHTSTPLAKTEIQIKPVPAVVRPQEDALTGISLRELEELSKTRFSRAAQRPKGRARGGSICGSVRSLAILVRAELTHSQKNLSIKKLDLYESLPGRFVMRSKVWRDSPDGN